MTVVQLISRLQTLDQSLRVAIETDKGLAFIEGVEEGEPEVIPAEDWPHGEFKPFGERLALLSEVA